VSTKSILSPESDTNGFIIWLMLVLTVVIHGYLLKCLLSPNTHNPCDQKLCRIKIVRIIYMWVYLFRNRMKKWINKKILFFDFENRKFPDFNDWNFQKQRTTTECFRQRKSRVFRKMWAILYFLTLEVFNMGNLNKLNIEKCPFMKTYIKMCKPMFVKAC